MRFSPQKLSLPQSEYDHVDTGAIRLGQVKHQSRHTDICIDRQSIHRVATYMYNITSTEYIYIYIYRSKFLQTLYTNKRYIFTLDSLDLVAIKFSFEIAILAFTLDLRRSCSFGIVSSTSIELANHPVQRVVYRFKLYFIQLFFVSVFCL